MVVLHIISGGEKGGSKNHLLSLSQEMKKRGNKNIILCFIEGELYKEAKKIGLDIYLVKQNKRFDLSVIKKIISICNENRVDIVNSHGGRANFISLFLVKKVRAKFITTIHSDYESDYKGNSYKTFIYTRINKFALKSFDYYIAVSNEFKNILIKRGFDGNKIFTIHNGIDTNRTLSTISKEECIKKYNIPSFDSYIGVIARLHPIKGHKNFLEACEKISDELNNIGIILLGSGDFEEKIKQQIENFKLKNNILFLGFKEPDDFLSIVDFTALTSYSESFPLVILESGLYGKTLLASRVGGIPEIIEDGVNGRLIDPNDVNDIKNKLLDLIENKENTIEYGKKLREDVINKHSLVAFGDSYEKICNKIYSEE